MRLMSTETAGGRLWRAVKRFLIGSLLIVGVLAVSVSVTLALIDGGYLNRAIEHWASFQLGRQVRFTSLRSHLLSKQPAVRIDGLTIANPDWLPNGNLAEVGRLVVRFRLWPLLIGHLDVPSLIVDRPVLHLVRLGPGRNNWTRSAGKTGPAFAPLRGVTQFFVLHGALSFQDRARDLAFQGTFQHLGSTTSPFSISGNGVLEGGPIRFRAVGGALNGAAVGQSYPFAATLADGRTLVRARGTSGDAFDLSRYALNVTAQGPNLADLGYLFNLITPNSAPFALSARAVSDGQHLRIYGLDMLTGGSHIRGHISSDRSRPRRDILATFDAPILNRSDIDAILSPVPPRTLASSSSGAVRPGLASHWLLSDAPISLRRMRGADFDFNIHVGQLRGYALPLTDISTRLDLDHGLLVIPSLRASLYSGRVTANGRIDGGMSLPAMRARVSLTGANLADVETTTKAPMKGRLDLAFNLIGNGNSLHTAAATARGTMSFRLAGAEVPRAAAWMIGGDLLRAAGAAVGHTGKTTALTCAVAKLRGSSGHLSFKMLNLATQMGVASGDGYIDLATESVQMRLQGRAFRRRLLQVAVPIQVAGPWFNPKIVVLPGYNARALGLKGKLGVLLTPIAGLLPLTKQAFPEAPCH